MTNEFKSLVVPAFCPICEMVMKGTKSTSSYYDHGCCSICHIEFVEGREERWSAGWRPDAAQLEAFRRKLGG